MFPSNKAGSPTHDFVSTTNGKRHAMSNQWGIPICEDGDVGRRVVTLGIPDDATGPKLTAAIVRGRFVTKLTLHLSHLLIVTSENEHLSTEIMNEDNVFGRRHVLTVRFEMSDLSSHGDLQVDSRRSRGMSRTLLALFSPPPSFTHFSARSPSGRRPGVGRGRKSPEPSERLTRRG